MASKSDIIFAATQMYPRPHPTSLRTDPQLCVRVVNRRFVSFRHDLPTKLKNQLAIPFSGTGFPLSDRLSDFEEELWFLKG